MSTRKSSATTSIQQEFKYEEHDWDILRRYIFGFHCQQARLFSILEVSVILSYHFINYSLQSPVIKCLLMGSTHSYLLYAAIAIGRIRRNKLGTAFSPTKFIYEFLFGF